MNYTTYLFLVLLICGCNEKDTNTNLKAEIDSLKQKLNDTYKPGFGEFMSSIQVHHDKLWFAGENENWKLADFEIHEIKEAIEDIEKYQTEREESKKVEMIKAPLDTVIAAIKEQNTAHFKSSYVLLTNTCNNCHKDTNFEFNQVKIPDAPPFSNQVFKTK